MIINPTPAAELRRGQVFVRKLLTHARRFVPKARAQFRRDYEAGAMAYQQTGGNVRQATDALRAEARAGWPKILYPFWRTVAADFGSVLFADAKDKAGLLRAAAEEESPQHGKEIAALLAILFGAKPGEFDDKAMKKLIDTGTLTSNVAGFTEQVEQWIVDNGQAEIDKLSGTSVGVLEAADQKVKKDGKPQTALVLLAIMLGADLARVMHRSTFVGTTEAHAASQIGLLIAAKILGLRLKGWSAVMDERTRRTHQAAHGQVVPINGLFQVGGSLMAYPGDPTAPPEEIVNCRCWLFFRTA